MYVYIYVSLLTLQGTECVINSILTLQWKLWNLIQSRPPHQKWRPGWWSEGGHTAVKFSAAVTTKCILSGIICTLFSMAVFIDADCGRLGILGYRVF